MLHISFFICCSLGVEWLSRSFISYSLDVGLLLLSITWIWERGYAYDMKGYALTHVVSMVIRGRWNALDFKYSYGFCIRASRQYCLCVWKLHHDVVPECLFAAISLGWVCIILFLSYGQLNSNFHAVGFIAFWITFFIMWILIVGEELF